MDKKLMGLLGAVSTLATATAALASPSPHPADGLDGALQARSFDDLLAPVPNAGAVLRALDEADAARVAREPEVELAQDYSEYARPRVFRPHHHHHHSVFRY